MLQPHKRTKEPGDDVLANVRTDALTGTNTEEIAFYTNRCGKTVRVTSIQFAADDAVTGDDSNNFTLEVLNKGVGGAANKKVASKKYDTGKDLAQFVADLLTLTTPVTTADEDLVLDGETLTFKKLSDGTGLDLPKGSLILIGQYL